MTQLLTTICTHTAEHVAACKQTTSLTELEQQGTAQSAPRGFAAALRAKVAADNAGLIAEIKKASPSRGLIRTDFDPAAHARDYEAGGAAGLSVLTDARYFQGSADDLTKARSACALPVLRKDFMIDSYQVAEARAMGADCILIIMAAVDDALAAELESAAIHYGMDALIEVHDEPELERALKHLRSPLIGINNRNLSTLSIDLGTSRRLAPLVPSERLVVCESGIGAAADMAAMRAHHIHCFLVGESLMSQPDLLSATQQLLATP